MSSQPDELRIDLADVNRGQLVRVAGEVDLHTSPQLRTLLLQVLEQEPELLILDLSAVSYMDSSGVGTMVELKRLAERQGGQVVLAGLQPRVRGVFEITQLDKFFAIVDNVDEACER